MNRVMRLVRGQRIPLRLARRDLARHRWSALMVILTMALPVAGYVAVVTLDRDSTTYTVDAEPQWQVANVRIVQKSQGSPTEQQEQATGVALLNRLPTRALVAIERQENLWCEARGPSGRSSVRLIRADVTNPITRHRFSRIIGDAETPVGELVITAPVARQLGATVGSFVTRCGVRYRVSAIATVRPGAEDHLLLLQEPLHLQDGLRELDTVWVKVSPQELAATSTAVNTVESLVALTQVGVRHRQMHGYVRSRGNYVAALLVAQTILGSVIAAVFVVINRRLRTTAWLLSLTGATRSQARSTLRWQGAICGTASGLLGCLITAISFIALSSSPPPTSAWSWKDIVLAILITVIMAATAASVSSRSIGKSGPTHHRSRHSWRPALAASLAVTGIVATMGRSRSHGMLDAIVTTVCSVALLWALAFVLMDVARRAPLRSLRFRLIARSLGRTSHQSAAAIAATATALMVLWTVMTVVASRPSSPTQPGNVAVLPADCSAIPAFLSGPFRVRAHPVSRSCQISKEMLVTEAKLPIAQTQATTIFRTVSGVGVIVGTPTVLNALGLTGSRSDLVAGNRVIKLDNEYVERWREQTAGIVAVDFIRIGLGATYVVSPAWIRSQQLDPSRQEVIITRLARNYNDTDRQALNDLYDDVRGVSFGVKGTPGGPEPAFFAYLRLLGSLGAAVICIGVIALTLALRNNEDRYERAVMSSVGLSPSLGRQLVAGRATVVAAGAMVIASLTSLCIYFSLVDKNRPRHVPWSGIALVSAFVIVGTGFIFWITGSLRHRRHPDWLRFDA
jgi:hypothetical protein